jgi:hypothetical protein
MTWARFEGLPFCCDARVLGPAKSHSWVNCAEGWSGTPAGSCVRQYGDFATASRPSVALPTVAWFSMGQSNADETRSSATPVRVLPRQVGLSCCSKVGSSSLTVG